MKWDYDVRTLSDADRLPVLKKMGNDGWELVGFREEPKSEKSTSPYNSYCTYFFKRRDFADNSKPRYTMTQLLEEERADLERGQTSEFGPVMLKETNKSKPASWREREQVYLEKRLREGPLLPKETNKPNFVLIDDPVLYLIVRMEDQNRILSIMSRAGYYIKDVTTDRKVDGAYVTYTFTARKKKNDNGN